MNEKKRLRQAVLTQRKDLSPAYIQAASQKIYERILASPAYLKAKTVFVYYGMPGELDTRPLIDRMHQEGRQVALPRVDSMAEGQMTFYRYQPGDPLVESRNHILEPDPQRAPILTAPDCDLLIMPCVTANYQGDRLGYGGGFYDRFLQEYRGPTLVALYAALLVEDIPMEAHDRRVDFVVTEDQRVDLPHLT